MKTKAKRIAEDYLEELEHFFVPGTGGWPLVERPHHKRLAILVPALKLENGLLKRVSNVKPDTEIMLELYKIKFEEISNAYNNLYDKVLSITKEF